MGATVITPSKGRTATIIVAASNASARSIQGADFVCAGSADQNTIASAVNALPASGGRIVFTEGLFVTSSPYLIVNSTIIFQGQGAATQFQSSTNNPVFKSSSTPFNDVAFDNLTFVGPVSNTVSVPTVARTTSGAGINIAIFIDGSLDPTGSFPLITNIIVRDCIVRNCTSLPIKLFGVTGVTKVTGCEFTNSKDVGFGYCQEVICTNNHSYMSSDNGISISRLNNKITCTGNTVELSAIDGIWLSGFIVNSNSTDEGPQDFSCTGNAVKNVGSNCIRLHDAPKYGVISGNVLDQGYNRGASDSLTDTFCNGIMIRGYPSTSPASPTDYAQGLSITGNTIRNAARSGIDFNGCKGLSIKNNLILDTGTQFMSDGSTSIAATNVTQNIGILTDFPATVSDVDIQGNIILDQRVTPYTNRGIYPYTDTTGITIGNNVMNGCRNANNLAPIAQNGHFGEGLDGVVTLDGTVTVPWASKSGSVYTLTRDVYCSDLTVNSGVSIATSGFIINCSGTLTNNGTIACSGSAGSGATGGAGGVQGSLKPGQAGVNGGTGAGSAPTGFNNALGGTGGTGGNSGASNGGAGGIITAPTAANGGSTAPQRLPYATMGMSITPVGGTQPWQGGSGGGSGAGDGTNAGGGGGGGGGVLIVNARYVIAASGSIMRALGGAGGNGVANNAAGGGGGGGGLLIVNTTSYTGTAPTAASNCTGGNAGTSQGTGTAASVGANGAVFLNIFS